MESTHAAEIAALNPYLWKNREEYYEKMRELQPYFAGR